MVVLKLKNKLSKNVIIIVIRTLSNQLGIFLLLATDRFVYPVLFGVSTDNVVSGWWGSRDLSNGVLEVESVADWELD